VNIGALKAVPGVGEYMHHTLHFDTSHRACLTHVAVDAHNNLLDNDEFHENRHNKKKNTVHDGGN
jgi:hypothetical protein